jgi:hypothetical protein
VIAGFEQWSFSVVITPAEPDTTGIVTSSDETKPLRIISVTCTAPGGSQRNVATIVSDVPNNVSNETSLEKWRRLTLTFKNRDFTVTAPLRNTPDAF